MAVAALTSVSTCTIGTTATSPARSATGCSHSGTGGAKHAWIRHWCHNRNDNQPYPPQPTRRRQCSPLSTRIITSTGIPLDMYALPTNTPSLCAVSSLGWYTSTCKAPPTTPPSVMSRWDRNCATSPEHLSHRSSTPPAPILGSPWVCISIKDPPGPSNLVAPWHYSS